MGLISRVSSRTYRQNLQKIMDEDTGFGARKDAFAEATANQVDVGQTDGIHIRIQQRNGRKTLTTVQGIDPKFDLKKIVRACKLNSLVTEQWCSIKNTARCYSFKET